MSSREEVAQHILDSLLQVLLCQKRVVFCIITSFILSLIKKQISFVGSTLGILLESQYNRHFYKLDSIAQINIQTCKRNIWLIFAERRHRTIYHIGMVIIIFLGSILFLC